MAKILILSGRYPQTTFNSAVNHKVYADLYGYDYIHCSWPTKYKNPYHNKIAYLLAHMEHYEYIIWIDDDAFFFDFETDIMKYAPSGATFMSACKSPSFKALKTYFSSGQFILRVNADSKAFLNAVLEQDLKEVKNWWRDDLGYFSNGDQDAMAYLFHEDEDYKEALELYDYKFFNSRTENIKDEDVHTPLILHFTGKPLIKEFNYQWVQKYLNLHSSLVPSQYLTSYNVLYPKKKPSFTRRFKNKLKAWLKA
jgi:hypothetical protein